jgi:hypothetical protein
MSRTGHFLGTFLDPKVPGCVNDNRAHRTANSRIAKHDASGFVVKAACHA